MAAKTYNSKKVQVSFLNQPITGFADGEFISAEMNSDQVTLVVGADGEGARAMSADGSGIVKLTLLQTSLGNDILTAALNKDRLTNLNVGPLLIKDVSGRTFVMGAEAWVKKFANVTLDKEVKAREWTLECADLQINVAGN